MNSPMNSPSPLSPFRSSSPRMLKSEKQDAAVQATPAHAQQPASGALWMHHVMPAISWLYSWVDRAGTSLPLMVEAEHRTALASYTEDVRAVMSRAQPDQLAACVWKALVTLLAHVRRLLLAATLAHSRARVPAIRMHARGFSISLLLSLCVTLARARSLAACAAARAGHVALQLGHGEDAQPDGGALGAVHRGARGD